ncbi:hypothetical protein DQ04_09511030 [Trypanosoma grayi]|uniref:hypothetical protein n=1 Tax=Trypanosoma grayi TaxID=71804 RepID=UPI0004F4A7E3|nr:hypothetical protein DQ04_09511030 [Trypanosoma grayi]KEG07538.1 hypothetical protein DQ04_09511030 [Trypanosoma grayi]
MACHDSSAPPPAACQDIISPAQIVLVCWPDNTPSELFHRLFTCGHERFYYALNLFSLWSLLLPAAHPPGADGAALRTHRGAVQTAECRVDGVSLFHRAALEVTLAGLLFSLLCSYACQGCMRYIMFLPVAGNGGGGKVAEPVAFADVGPSAMHVRSSLARLVFSELVKGRSVGYHEQ